MTSNISPRFTRRLLTQFIRVLLGLVLIAAAFLKWRYPGHEASFYGMLAKGAPVWGWTILTTEVILGCWMLTGFRLPVAGAATVFLLSVFTGAIVSDMLSLHPKPCGCFGAAWAVAHSPAVIERDLAIGVVVNILLMVMAAFLFLDTPAKALATGAERSDGA